MNRFLTNSAQPPLRVALLDAEQGILDGYHFRLDPLYHIHIVAEALTGAEFEEQLAQRPADVALLGLLAPAAPDNPAAYPLVHAIPRLRQHYPGLAILVVAHLADPQQIHTLIEAGARGYLVKSDAGIYPALSQILVSVAHGGVYYSPTAEAALRQHDPEAAGPRVLSRRQLQAVALCAAYPRRTLHDIAQEMDVSASTVRNLLSQAYQRLNVASRAEAVLRAQQLGLLPRERT